MAQGAHQDVPRRVEVVGEAALASEAAARHWLGNGSAANPYRIQNVAISAIGGTGIALSATRSHVVISGVTVSAGGSLADGIRLTNVSNVTIADATLESNRASIVVQDSRDVVIERASVKTSLVGVSLERSTNVTLSHSRLSVNEVDVKLTASSGNVLRNNNLSIATGQTAIRIEDDASLRNDADSTNVVNFVPLQWHVGAANVTISSPRSELKGVTNVAQILLVDANNVTLDAPVAKAGEGSGILVDGSSDVRILNATVEGNAKEGLLLHDAPRAAVLGGSTRGNGDGLVASKSPGAHVADLLAERNTRDGARLKDSAGANVSASRFVSNGGAGLALEATLDARVEDNVASRNGGAGLLLSGVRAPRVLNNTLVENAWGARLAATSGGQFQRNSIVAGEAGVGLHFDDRASYDNAIATTNTYGGQPIHWYVNVTGLTVEDLRAELPRITNVAQAMVLRSTNVTLVRAEVANGSADGLVVIGSERISLVDSAARTSARSGIYLEDSANASIGGTVARRNGQHGVHAVRSANVTLASSGLVLNGGDGARVERSPGARFESVTAERNGGRGVWLVDGQGGASSIARSTFTSNQGGGVHVERATLAALEESVFTRNAGAALRFSGATAGFNVARNSFQNHSTAIQLEATSGGAFERNSIATRPGQTGLHFDGPASYSNALPPSNLFNGAPIRWYVGLNGTKEAPVMLDGLRSTAAGVTNVAQVMVHASSNVTIRGVDAANGTKHGLVVHRSRNVTVEDVVSRQNGAAGVATQESRDVRFLRVRSAGNGGDGFLGERASRLTLISGRLEDNARLGGRLAETDLALDRSEIVRNGEGGVVIELAGGPSSIERSTIADNRGAGISMRLSPLGRIGDATLRNGTDAVVLADVTGGAIEATTISEHARGIVATRSSVARIVGNNLTANGESGLHLASPRGPTVVEGNTFTNHSKAIRLSEAAGGSFVGNVIRALPRQTGLHFEDVVSYDNRIETSNTFNGETIHWHTGLRDTVLDGVRMQLPGVTNVAQAMIYNAVNVTVAGPRTTDGIGDGLVLYAARNVTVLDAESRGNRGYGVAIARGSNNTIEGGASYANRAGGLYLSAAPDSAIRNATLRDNLGPGARVGTDSDGSELSGLRVHGNERDGIRVGESAAVAVARSDLRDNQGAGIHLDKAEAGARLEGNTLANHSFGIRLSQTRLARLSANDMALPPGGIGLQFDDETSYDNEIGISNRVNGVGVRWYTALAGTESAPVRLEGIRVELPGITNVAQVMLYRSAYVQVPDAVAANGTRGIYLYRSSSIAIDNATVPGNDVGVQLESTQSSAVWGARASGTRIGALLRSSNSNQIALMDATSARIGVQLDAASAGNRVFGTRATSVHEWSVSDPSASGSRGNNLVVDAGRDLRAGEGRPVSFTGALSTSRFESERIVSQRWEFGDGQAAERAQSSPYRPTHVYGKAGRYDAGFVVTTADGRVYADNVTVTVVGPLGAPRAVSAIEAPGLVSLTWEPPASDGGDPIVEYRVYRGNASDNLSLLANVTGAAAHADAAPLPASAYYAVAAVNAQGEGPRSVGILSSPGALPDAPALVAASAGARNVTLSWDPPGSTGGLPILAYEIFRREAGAASDSAAPAHARVTGTTFLDDGLVDGTSYAYEVLAVNALGSGPRSATVAATPTSPPAAPLDVQALAGDRRVTVVWRAPPAHPEAPILQYRVYRGAAEADQVLIAQVVDPMHRDEALSNAEEYGYAISAVTRAGEGARSKLAFGAPSPVDEAPPVLVRATPDRDELVGDLRPRVDLLYADNGPDVRATLRLDNRTVEQASGAQTTLSWRPGEGIGYGLHSLSVRLADAAGHATEETWTFRILTAREQQPILEWNVTPPAEPVVSGREFTTLVNVRNVGYVGATMPVALTLSGLETATLDLDLPVGAETNLTFVAKAPKSGTYELGVHDSNKTSIRVIPPPLPPPSPTTATPTPTAASEEEGSAGIPGAPAALVLLAIAVAALRGRRRA